MSQPFLLDTHALLFWDARDQVSEQFLAFLDEQGEAGLLFVSSISIWETAILAQKGRIEIELGDVNDWKDELLNTNIQLLPPTPNDMILSAQLPMHHKDPFDRVLIAQAVIDKMQLVTRDRMIKQYNVSTFWM